MWLVNKFNEMDVFKREKHHSLNESQDGLGVKVL